MVVIVLLLFSRIPPPLASVSDHKMVLSLLLADSIFFVLVRMMLPVALNVAVASAPLALEMLPDSVRLPPSASAARFPLTAAVPRGSAFASFKVKSLPETTETAPVKSLDELSSVILLPAPAVMPVVPVTVRAADWVMVPLPVRVRFSLAVTAPLTAMVEFVRSVVLSLKVVAPPTVIAPAVALPIVMPEKPSVKLVEK
ncbi:MAG: hypothetical protein BWX54_02144 [Verrucomicrobia bacterium ADurb.Bin018]|nr:MAG: hypothetical protein BWX54_02144 [Verrucomicrobia bacterium ADurb.Bin018]